ncbi:Elongation factor 1-delta [Glycine max]|nr:Elongation factor 1-delta [Glycine max]
MAVTLYDLSSASGLKKLDQYLLPRSYITGYVYVTSFFFFFEFLFLMYQASKDDLTVIQHCQLLHHMNMWYKHIDALLRISGVSGEGSLVAAPPTADTKATGKSSVMLDVKPWDDETDMKKLEEAVRSIEMEGLLFGAFSVDDRIEERLTVEPINEYNLQSWDLEIKATRGIANFRNLINVLHSCYCHTEVLAAELLHMPRPIS